MLVRVPLAARFRVLRLSKHSSREMYESCLVTLPSLFRAFSCDRFLSQKRNTRFNNLFSDRQQFPSQFGDILIFRRNCALSDWFVSLPCPGSCSLRSFFYCHVYLTLCYCYSVR